MVHCFTHAPPPLLMVPPRKPLCLPFPSHTMKMVLCYQYKICLRLANNTKKSSFATQEFTSFLLAVTTSPPSSSSSSRKFSSFSHSEFLTCSRKWCCRLLAVKLTPTTAKNGHDLWELQVFLLAPNLSEAFCFAPLPYKECCITFTIWITVYTCRIIKQHINLSCEGNLTLHISFLFACYKQMFR